MKNKQIFLLVLTIFFISFASASYTFTNYSIEKQYSIGSNLSGNIEISFQNESLKSFFEDSLGNQALLKNILDKSQNYAYNCTYKNCMSSYKSSNPENSKKFSLKKGNEKIIGFILKGIIQNIKSVSFSITSDAKESNSNQIKIDFLNDGTAETGNSRAGSELTGKENYGCFNQSKNPQEISLSSTPFCQKIRLNESPRVMLGAWIKENVAGSNPITMSIYNKEGSFLKSCNVSKSEITSQGKEVFCNVDLPILKKEDYFVCSSMGNGLGEYKLLGYSSKNNNCGFLGSPVKNETATYKIGVRPRMFAIPGTIIVGNTLPDGEKISSLIQNYINLNYKKTGCVDGCYIPIRLISFSNQNITLNNLKVDYDALSLPGLQLKTFYNFDSEDSKVDSSLQKLSLDGFFPLPRAEGKEIYELKFKGKRIFKEEISMENFPMNLYPLEMTPGFPVKFFALTPGMKISSYLWNFGDNSTELTSSPTVIHTYQENGNFTLKISLVFNETKFSKSFKIKAIPLREFVKKELTLKKENLEAVENQISKRSVFEKKEIEKILNIKDLKTKLLDLEKRELRAGSDSDYKLLMSDLLSSSFPKAVLETNSKKVFFVPSEDSIDLSILGEITGINYPNNKSSLDYVSFWNYQNLNTKILEKNIIIEWENGLKSSMFFYDFSIIPKNSINESYYFILTKTDGVEFKNPTIAKRGDGYKYIFLGDRKISFSFMTKEDLESSFFIAPKNMGNLNSTNVGEFKNEFWVVILGLIGVFLIGLLIYWIIQRWYKVKYERYLFPDKNQLYNAIIYINSSRKGGIGEEEIRKNLLKVGWKGEQVRYLLKKYAGKRTGMVDIFDFLKKKEIVSDPPNPGGNVKFKSSKNTKFNK